MTAKQHLNIIKGKYTTYFFIVIFLMAPLYLNAQSKDSTTQKNTFDTVIHLQSPSAIKDTAAKSTINITSIGIHDSGVSTKAIKKQPNPKKAGLYSAILPGLGQVYDGKYWKVPIIYAGLGVAAGFFEYNLSNYQDYRKAYIGRFNNPYPTDKYLYYTKEQLKLLQDDYAKRLDLTVLFTGIGYILQIMDAVVYAHLKNFDISEDLSFKIRPVATPEGAAMGLVLNIKAKHFPLPHTD